MTEPLDLDALKSTIGPHDKLFTVAHKLIAELEATRAERDRLLDRGDRFVERHAQATARAERAEAELEATRERNATLHVEWQSAVTRAEKAEAEIDRRALAIAAPAVQAMRNRAERAEAAIARVEALYADYAPDWPSPDDVLAALRGE